MLLYSLFVRVVSIKSKLDHEKDVNIFYSNLDNLNVTKVADTFIIITFVDTFAIQTKLTMAQPTPVYFGVSTGNKVKSINAELTYSLWTL